MEIGIETKLCFERFGTGMGTEVSPGKETVLNYGTRISLHGSDIAGIHYKVSA